MAGLVICLLGAYWGQLQGSSYNTVACVDLQKLNMVSLIDNCYIFWQSRQLSTGSLGVISGLAVGRRQLSVDLKCKYFKNLWRWIIHIHHQERGDDGAGGHRRRGLEDIEGEVQ